MRHDLYMAIQRDIIDPFKVKPLGFVAMDPNHEPVRDSYKGRLTRFYRKNRIAEVQYATTKP